MKLRKKYNLLDIKHKWNEKKKKGLTELANCNRAAIKTKLCHKIYW